jgi:hypothetical protein
MSVARVLVKQGDEIYRFLKFEARPDGSLLAFLDRDPSPRLEAMTICEDGTFVPDGDAIEGVAPHAKISCHTTGEVHYYAGGVRRNTFYIEPLHILSRSSIVGYFSIPRVPRLNRLDEQEHRHDVAAILDIPVEIAERMTFVLELAPNAPAELGSYGVSLNYEVYSAVVRVVANLVVPPGMTNHFIYGTPVAGQFDARPIDKVSAELGFHHRVHGPGILVFREHSGAYVLLTEVPMRVAPRLTVTFHRSDLRIEPIPFGKIQEPTHKLRFWICDRGGRNRTEDLRRHIASIKLDAGF